MLYTEKNNQPVRVLHIVGGMIYGGIETWLMQILRHIDREHLQMDFLVHKAGNYDQEIQNLGSKVIYFPYLSNPLLYGKKFRELLRQNPSYDITHCHLHHFNGYVLRLAKQAGITVRIAHSHTDSSSKDDQVSWYRRFYLSLMKAWVNKYSTVNISNTLEAGKCLFGDGWETDPRSQILNLGVDLTPFKISVDSQSLRQELGIPIEAFVIGHVGRFVKVKNHQFLLEVVAEVAKNLPNICLLLVGEGELRADIERKAIDLGLGDRVIFTGVRSDISRLMLGAMDIFIFPSLYEGLGNVRLEAQAAGLTNIVSDTVPKEGDIIPSLIHRLSLSQSASLWAEKILDVRQNPPQISQSEAFKLIESSPFTISHSAKNLINIYLQQLALNL